MHERIINMPTANGRMETFITHPEQKEPFAPVVIYMDVWGLHEELLDIARKVAVVGHYVLLPDLYRQGRIRHQWRNELGQMISMHNLDPERRALVRAPLQKLSDAMVVADQPPHARRIGFSLQGQRRAARASQSPSDSRRARDSVAT
jgi:dienelactone hydrolase